MVCLLKFKLYRENWSSLHGRLSSIWLSNQPRICSLSHSLWYYFFLLSFLSACSFCPILRLHLQSAFLVKSSTAWTQSVLPLNVESFLWSCSNNTLDIVNAMSSLMVYLDCKFSYTGTMLWERTKPQWKMILLI